MSDFIDLQEGQLFPDGRNPARPQRVQGGDYVLRCEDTVKAIFKTVPVAELSESELKNVAVPAPAYVEESVPVEAIAPPKVGVWDAAIYAARRMATKGGQG